MKNNWIRFKKLGNYGVRRPMVLIIITMFNTYACRQKSEPVNIGQKEPLIGGESNNLTTDRNTVLFNGKNLNGWYLTTRDSNYSGVINDLFAVKNGMIHVYPKQEPNSAQTFAGIITNKSYSKYILKVEYKWGEKKFSPREEMVRDAGVLFHVHGFDTIWPNSVECQIQGGDTGDIWAIGTQVTSKVQAKILNYSPDGEMVVRGDKNKRFSRFHRGYDWEMPHGHWNSLEITVNGDHAIYKLNGHIVNEAIAMKYWDKDTADWQPLISGKILLQAEGAEIFYRNIYLKEL